MSLSGENYFDKAGFNTKKVKIRRGYNVSKRLVKLTRFKRFPLQLSGYQDIPL